MSKIKLAEALLKRKELSDKVSYLQKTMTHALQDTKVQRVRVSDGFDDLTVTYPKITVNELTAALDWHSKQLRLVDGYIQQANWTTELEVPDSVMSEFVAPATK